MRHILTFLVLALLLFVGCEKRITPGVPSQVRADLKLLPEQIDFVLFGDISSLAQSDFGSRLVADFMKEVGNEEKEKEFQAFKEAMSPEALKELIIGVQRGEEDQFPFYVLIRGNLDEQKIVNYTEQKAKEKHREFEAHINTVNGKHLYILTKDFAAAFAGNGLLLVGPANWVTARLQGKKPETSLTDNPKIMALVDRVTYGNQFWVIANQPLKFRGGKFPPMETPQGQKIKAAVQSAIFSAQIDENIKFEGRVQCDNEENSKSLADLMKGGLAAIKLSAAGDRTTVDALNRIQVQQKGPEAVVSGMLTKELIEAMKSRRLAMKK